MATTMHSGFGGAASAMMQNLVHHTSPGVLDVGGSRLPFDFGDDLKLYGLHPLSRFLGNPDNPQHLNQYDTLHRNFQFPEVYKKGGVYIGEMVVGLVIFDSNSFVLSESDGLPIIHTDEQYWSWDRIIFNRSLMDVVPEEGVSRIIRSKYASGSAGTIRHGIALYNEHGFLYTEKGTTHYYRSMVQLANCVQLTFEQMTIQACLNVRSDEFEREMGRSQKFFGKNRGLLLRLKAKEFCCAQKSSDGLRQAVMDRIVAGKRKGYNYGTMWAPKRGEQFFVGVGRQAVDYNLAGPSGPGRMSVDPLSVNSYCGLRIQYISEYISDIDGQPIDHFRNIRMFGSFFRMMGDKVHSISPMAYKTYQRDIDVYNGTKDNYDTISLKEALDNLDVFEAPTATGYSFLRGNGGAEVGADETTYISDTDLIGTGDGTSVDDLFGTYKFKTGGMIYEKARFLGECHRDYVPNELILKMAEVVMANGGDYKSYYERGFAIGRTGQPANVLVDAGGLPRFGGGVPSHIPGKFLAVARLDIDEEIKYSAAARPSGTVYNRMGYTTHHPAAAEPVRSWTGGLSAHVSPAVSPDEMRAELEKNIPDTLRAGFVTVADHLKANSADTYAPYMQSLRGFISQNATNTDELHGKLVAHFAPLNTSLAPTASRANQKIGQLKVNEFIAANPVTQAQVQPVSETIEQEVPSQIPVSGLRVLDASEFDNTRHILVNATTGEFTNNYREAEMHINHNNDHMLLYHELEHGLQVPYKKTDSLTTGARTMPYLRTTDKAVEGYPDRMTEVPFDTEVGMRPTPMAGGRIDEVAASRVGEYDYSYEEMVLRFKFARSISSGNAAVTAALRNMFLRFCFMLLTKENLMELIDRNIPFPFGFLIMRPFNQVATSSLLMGEFGRRLGMFPMGTPDVMLGNDAAPKSHTAHLTVYGAPIIWDSECLSHVDDAYMIEYFGGMNCTFFSPAHREQLLINDWCPPSPFEFPNLRDFPSIFSMITVYRDPLLKTEISIRREWTDDRLDSGKQRPHFITTKACVDNWNFGTVESDHPFNPDRCCVATEFLQGFQRCWARSSDTFTRYILGTDCMGPVCYPGMMDVLELRGGNRNGVLQEFDVSQNVYDA